jgi:hypothetical protein
MAIVVMSSFLDGIVITVWRGFEGLGFDGVVYVENHGARDLREQSINARSKGLQPGDADVIMARRKLVSAVAPVEMDQEIVRRGSTSARRASSESHPPTPRCARGESRRGAGSASSRSGLSRASA